MQITVFGANGKVGRLVVAEALRRRHSVVGFVHSRSNLTKNKQLTIVRGDVGDPTAVSKAIKGSGAVISALGSWGTPNKDVLKTGMKTIIPAMRAQRINQIVSITGHGANAPGDKFKLLHEFSRLILLLLAPKILNDGEEHIKLLAASGLSWTAVRSPLMVSHGNPLSFRLSLKRPLPLAIIHRQAVATCLVDLAETKDYNKQSPFIVRK